MKFLFGAVDFLIEDGEPFFVEANSAPGARLLMAQDSPEPLEALAGAVQRRVKDPVAAIIARRGEKDAGTDWKAEIIGRTFPAHVCYIWDQDYDTEEYVDLNGDEFTPNVILFNSFVHSQIYEGEALEINPTEILRITMDKNLTMTVVKNRTSVRTPSEFMVFSPSSARRVIEAKREHFDKGLVVKPLFGSGGKWVHVWAKVPSELPRFGSTRLLQSRIDVDKRDGKFWDVRAYVVDGKFCGGVSRVSDEPVVNLHRGGSFSNVEDDLADVVAGPSEEVVSAINEAAVALGKREDQNADK